MMEHRYWVRTLEHEDCISAVTHDGIAKIETLIAYQEAARR